MRGTVGTMRKGNGKGKGKGKDERRLLKVVMVVRKWRVREGKSKGYLGRGDEGMM